MPLALVGTLPVSAVNLGIVAGLSGLSLEISKLTADVSALNAAVLAQAQVSAEFPPNPLSFATALAAQFSVPEITTQFNPANWATMGADVSADLAIQLGLLTAEIATLDALVVSLSAGVDAGGIAGWTYAGRAGGFGIELERATAIGAGALTPDDEVTGIVIATESFGSWGSFSNGVNVGRTAAAEATATAQRLSFLGSLDGGDWNTGVLDLLARFRPFLLDLNAAKAGLEASAQVALGLNLPDIQAQVDVGLAIFADLGVTGLLDNLVNVQVDLSASIGTINAQIGIVTDLVAELSADLSAGGLSFWTYSGSVRALGTSLHSALQQGIPSGSGAAATAYGLALIGTPASMTTFGTIFKTS